MQWIAPFRLHPIIPAMLLLAGLSAAACRDGGGAATAPGTGRGNTTAPGISGLKLEEGELESGKTARFTANTFGLVTRWDWDLGAGATPTTSTEAEPTVSFPASGRFTGRCWVTNAFGTSAPYTFTYSVGGLLPPQVSRITPGFEMHMATTRIQRFTAVLGRSGGRPKQFDWTITGGETVGPTNNSVVAFRAQTPGRQTGELRIANDHGESLQPFSFQIIPQPSVMSIERIAKSELPHGIARLSAEIVLPNNFERGQAIWHFITPATASSQQELFVSGDPSGTIEAQFSFAQETTASGTLTICQNWNCSDPIPFSFPLEPVGTIGTWHRSALPIPKTGTDKKSQSMEIRENRPVLAFIRERKVSYVEALVSDPDSPTDWQMHEVGETVQAPSISSPQIRLWFIDNRPVIVVRTNQTSTYFSAQSEHPVSSADWNMVTGVGGSELAIGDPQRLFRSSTGEFWRALLEGHAPQERWVWLRNPGGHLPATEPWIRTYVTETGTSAGFPYIAEFESKPVIIDSPFFGHELHCFAARSVVPATPSDWTHYQLNDGVQASAVSDFQTTSLGLVLLINEANAFDRRGLRVTHDPLSGADAWESWTAAQQANSQYVHNTAIGVWRDQLLQVDDLGTYNAQLLIGRSNPLTGNRPQSAEDWRILAPFSDITTPGTPELRTTSSHLYIAGVDDTGIPTLLWTTDDF